MVNKLPYHNYYDHDNVYLIKSAFPYHDHDYAPCIVIGDLLDIMMQQAGYNLKKCLWKWAASHGLCKDATPVDNEN